ncbi:DHA2 family efflux MFS transporter permease subunit [Agromyces sp. MMS24-JH15]|uniref:DHA2 family efflux MFS transporter permease subunit n=1 Tax=Agromyces sp. MMS24-JH15 TaxID=3243765 RepID=UPI0037495FCD
MQTERKPWPALWALVIGFFMILVDTTIVSVANPAILEHFDAGITEVLWVTSAYLLAYAVPLLITGRLGDRFGPKRVYLVGLFLFTAASLGCGLSGTITLLIIARVVQGLGAALMTPQTMAVITRIFPPTQRGAAMGLWGATSGVATLIGPILGGVLVDTLGWQWIFIVNVPVGIVGLILAWRLVPDLETHAHRFDWLGVVLSGVGMFLLVFGIQEGETYDWGTITGPITVWGLIITGILVLVAFVVWQRFNPAEPLLPLSLFRDRNFSLANIAIAFVGFGVVAMSLPLTFYAQLGLGLSPTVAALLLSPMAVVTGIASPLAGRLTDRVNPKWIAATGLVIIAASLGTIALLVNPDIPVAWVLIPAAFLGLGMGGVWAPLASTANRNLPPQQAGAGSGVYNMTRQVGSVLGSAAITALITARIAAELPGIDASGAGMAQAGAGAMPDQVLDGFARAMSQSVWLSVAGFLVAAVVALWFARPKVTVAWGAPEVRADAPVADGRDLDAPEPGSPAAAQRARAAADA